MYPHCGLQMSHLVIMISLENHDSTFCFGSITEEKHDSYPAVVLLVEDLWWQRVAFFRQLVPGDVAVHPQPLLLQHGDVYLLEADSIGLQETHHCLLVLLYLEVRKRKDKKCECRF